MDPACVSPATTTEYAITELTYYKTYCDNRPGTMVIGIGFDDFAMDLDHLICVSYVGVMADDDNVVTSSSDEPCPDATMAMAIMAEGNFGAKIHDFDKPSNLKLGCYAGICGWEVTSTGCITVLLDAGGSPPVLPGLDISYLKHWVVCPNESLYALTAISRSSSRSVTGITCCEVKN